MSRFIKLTFIVLAVALGATGAMGAGAATSVRDGDSSNFVAVMRDESADLVARESDDDDDDDNSRDISNSRDRSADITTPDRSRSLDRSKDRTGDRVNALDRSNSLDFSLDRTGDHNTADVSRSNDVSQNDDTSDSVSQNDDTGDSGDDDTDD
jgi:hypothetical protein